MKRALSIFFVALSVSLLIAGCSTYNWRTKIKCKAIMLQDSPPMYPWSESGRGWEAKHFSDIRRGDTLRTVYEMLSWKTGGTDFVVLYQGAEYFIESKFAKSVIEDAIENQSLTFWIPDEDDKFAWSHAVALTAEIAETPIHIQTDLMISSLPNADTGAPGYEVTKKYFGDGWEYNVEFFGAGPNYSPQKSLYKAKKLSYRIESWYYDPCAW